MVLTKNGFFNTKSQNDILPKDNLNENFENTDSITQKYPKSYRVEQNSNYVMVEYADRYELFYEKDGLHKYIRTDYK